MGNDFIFKNEICGWSSWGDLFQSIEVWEPLVNIILGKENLPVSKIENLKPGTNAVFRSGKFVIKIYAPGESGIDGARDKVSELFALSFAGSLGVPVSKIIASGEIMDKYNFSYVILEYLEGLDFKEASSEFTEDDKYRFAGRMREITDTFNIPCKPFNGIDVIHDPDRSDCWASYSEHFRKERLDYIGSHEFGKKIFVHGDLCYDNLIIDEKGTIRIIDFADSVLAPQCYEHGHLASVLFNFDRAYLSGYFGNYPEPSIVDLCFNGLIIHDFGGDIVDENIAKPEEIDCLDDLRKKIINLLK